MKVCTVLNLFEAVAAIDNFENLLSIPGEEVETLDPDSSWKLGM